MGRYYSGDIEGKFWFGVQGSDDADFFGVQGYMPNYLEYEFEKDDLPNVEVGIARCRANLGSQEKALDDFFDKHNAYNDKMLVDEGIFASKSAIDETLKWYARLKLGEKIAESIKTKGHCRFNAEC